MLFSILHDNVRTISLIWRMTFTLHHIIVKFVLDVVVSDVTVTFVSTF